VSDLEESDLEDMEDWDGVRRWLLEILFCVVKQTC
jgi:hypothetical protein